MRIPECALFKKNKKYKFTDGVVVAGFLPMLPFFVTSALDVFFSLILVLEKSVQKHKIIYWQLKKRANFLIIMNEWVQVTLSLAYSTNRQLLIRTRKSSELLFSKLNSGQAFSPFYIDNDCKVLPRLLRMQFVKRKIKLRCVEPSVRLMLILLWAINFGIAIKKKQIEIEKTKHFSVRTMALHNACTLIDYHWLNSQH